MSKDPIPDFSTSEEAGAWYEEMIRKSLDHFDRMKESLLEQQGAIQDELAAARQRLLDIETHADQLTEERIEANIRIWKEEVSQKLKRDLAGKAIDQGRSHAEIMAILGVDAQMMEELKQELGFRKWEGRDFRVRYVNQGRGGSVLLDLGEKTLRLDWEFAMSPVLAMIFIPGDAAWKTFLENDITLREPLLEAFAREVVRVQSPGGLYRINDSIIEIYRRDDYEE